MQVALPLTIPEPLLEPLRTGEVVPVEQPPLELSVLRRADLGSHELFELPLPTSAELMKQDPGGTRWYFNDGLRSAYVALDTPLDSFAFVEASNTPRLWIRRKKSPLPLSGAILTGAVPSQPGFRVPFRAAPNSPKQTPKLEEAWATATIGYLGDSTSPVWAFATARLAARYLPAKTATTKAARALRAQPGTELSRLMDTTTGRLSVQRALERDRELFLAAAKQKTTVAFDTLAAPRLSHHPWAEMKKLLATDAPDEPLARAAPAEFYFVRAKDFGKLLDLVDLVEEFGEPAADLLDGQAESRGTLVRYEAELGLARSALTRAFGPAIVSELALVGSDPYVHEGSDLTLIFRVKNAALFGSALSAALARHAALHPNVVESTLNEAGVVVTVKRSQDGRIRQHRATMGDLELVSNSAAAIRRVIATIQGKHPSLAAEADFQYMCARDARTPNDELIYFGDRFIASVIGPAQKIAEARRQIALGELLAPGYSALTYGLINGRSPAQKGELLKAKLLKPAELSHADGSAIDWEPGHPAHSVWGTLAALEPLLERPAITRVTDAERRGYEEFARAYERLWSDQIDPIALRIHTEQRGKTREVVADLRVLPTLRNEYWEMIRTVGNVHLDVPSLIAGFAGVIGIRPEASLRRELSSTARMFGIGERLTLDWLGDYALVGATSRNELANALRPYLARKLEKPAEDRESFESQAAKALANLPAYAAVAVKSRLGAGVFLTAVRNMARQAAPGIATWTEAAPYRGNDVVAVRLTERQLEVVLYYALMKDALVLALNEVVLHQVIDQLTDHPPQRDAPGAAGTANSGQLVLELSYDPKSALDQVLTWLATAGLVEGAAWPRDLSRSFLLGTRDVPANLSDGLMRAYLGTLVVTPEGSPYRLSAEGIFDPVRGTPHHPVWPKVPVVGSSVERVLARLGRLRSSLAFDEEPTPATLTQKLSSLHARMRLELR